MTVYHDMQVINICCVNCLISWHGLFYEAKDANAGAKV